MIDSPFTRRSCLSVPGSSTRMLAKAMIVPADEVVMDLEDAVVKNEKADALTTVVRALEAWRGPPVSVRVNQPRSPWCHTELASLATVETPLRSVVVPKVEEAGDLAFVERLLDGAETAAGRTEPLGVQALIESPSGLARAQEIAGASPRLEALILGYADLAASLGRPAIGPFRLEFWLSAQETVLVAARAHGLQAVDGPFLGTTDDDPFRAAAGQARALGFDGKWAIHPAQVPALNELFSPSPEEIAHAEAVLDALARAEAQQRAGAVALGGEMLDEAVRRSALGVLGRARPAHPSS